MAIPRSTRIVPVDTECVEPAVMSLGQREFGVHWMAGVVEIDRLAWSRWAGYPFQGLIDEFAGRDGILHAALLEFDWALLYTGHASDQWCQRGHRPPAEPASVGTIRSIRLSRAP